MSKTFQTPKWLLDEVKAKLPEDKELLELLKKDPQNADEPFRKAAQKKYLPNEIVKAWETGTQELVYQSAKQWCEKWRLYKKFISLKEKFTEKSNA